MTNGGALPELEACSILASSPLARGNRESGGRGAASTLPDLRCSVGRLLLSMHQPGHQHRLLNGLTAKFVDRFVCKAVVDDIRTSS